MKFIRYGSLKIQSHDISNRTYHTPPVKNGIYAFPVGYVEMFLLGGLGAGSIQNGRYRFLRDENGNKIKDISENVVYFGKTGKKDKDSDDEYKFIVTEKYSEFFKKNNIDAAKVQPYYLDEDGCVNGMAVDENEECFFVVENEPVKFEYSGNIWCHFGEYVKRNEIIREVGSWILVEHNLYKKLLKKAEYSDKLHRLVQHDESGYCCKNILNFNSVSGYPLDRFDKVKYEVFIEKL